MAAVYPSAFSLELGLSGGYRDTLIDASYNALTLPLSELQSTRAFDISGRGNHGLYEGTGFTRGVEMSLPEGGLGLTFNGSGRIRVPDDSGSPSNWNLSLANGDIDFSCLLKDVPSSATLRCIAGKQVSTSTGNGWHVAVQNGAIEFFLRVSGSTIFSFQRGSIAGSTERLINCVYTTTVGTGEARIFVDGVQAGATVTGVTTEPAVTAGDLIVGQFADLSGGFVGTMAYVGIAREGDLVLPASLQATRSWTTVSADVRGMPIHGRYGIPGSSPLDNVATTGTLTFVLNNAAHNSGGALGYYTPGHANCRAGFGMGIPIRYSLTYGGVTKYLFRGRVIAIQPSPGLYGPRTVQVTCACWMDVAANTPMSAVPLAIDLRSEQALGLAIDQAKGRTPPKVSLGAGSSAFPFTNDVGEGESEMMTTEISRVCASERGYFYPVGNTTSGFTYTYEGRGARQITSSLDATFSSTMHGIDVDYSVSHMVNIVRAVVTPRKIDLSDVVLYEVNVSQTTIQIAPGETKVFEGGYRNPNEQAVRVGGASMITPVLDTDYGFWTDTNGSAVSLGPYLQVKADLGGNSFRVTLTNVGTNSGYLTQSSGIAFQVRGRGVYHYAPITVERRDDASVRRYGPRAITIGMPYETNQGQAEAVADFTLGIISLQRPIPKSIAIKANANATLMAAALNLEPGDKVGLIEPMTAVTTTASVGPDVGYFINEKTFTHKAGGLLEVQFTLAPAAPSGVGVFDQSSFDEDLVFGF